VSSSAHWISFSPAHLPGKITGLNRKRSIRRWAALSALAAVVWASGCGVALAPGYKIASETRTVRFVPGSPGSLQISLHYDLKNTGTAPLAFLDVTLPDATAFGTHDLHVRWDGHPVALQDLPLENRADHPNTRRIDFESPWARGSTGKLDVQYAFGSPRDSGARITIGSEAFHLSSLGWAALPQPPPHFLSSFPSRPPKMIYTVRVPNGFLVLARGKLKHRKTEQSETEYEFLLTKNDLAPFVVAGRYIVTRLAQGSVVFWTLHPLAESAGATPQRIANAWATLERDFGPIEANVQAPHIVEAPTLRSRLAGPNAPAVASFPGGALVNEQTLALGIATDAFVESASHALAHNWFTDQMYPSGAAALGMGEGLPEYATIVIDEAEGGADARRDRVEYFLNRYKSAREHAKETPLGVTMLTDPPGPREVALAKAPLMYVALEDTCGEQPVRNALKSLVTLLRGQEVGFDDLRSAMEQTCGRDLGEFFRTWLYGKELPADFAAGYESGKTR
jgi:hypothetical protein